MEVENTPGGRDRDQISINEGYEAYEIRYWSDRFKVSPERLHAAIDAVGTSVSAVEVHLNANG